MFLAGNLSIQGGEAGLRSNYSLSRAVKHVSGATLIMIFVYAGVRSLVRS